VGVATIIDACVIADPPSDLPRLGEMRPTIVRESVVPSMSSVLGRWPTTFVVPVELSDPQAEIAWASFIDYNPATGAGVQQFDVAKPGSSTNGRIHTLEIPIQQPADNGCHVVEIVVGLRLNALNVHTPEPPGGDTATWLFNLSGDLSGCPIRDAGIVPIIDADAGADAGGGT
jgi:hypothetical protein